jgi:hypothetical protein
MKLKNTTLFATSLMALAFALPVVAEDDHGHEHEDHEHEEHGSHVHGTAHLNVAQIKGELTLELHSPAANIVGFEHAPRTAEEKQSLHRATHMLEEDEKLLLLPAEAKCSRVSSQVESEMAEHEEHDHEKAEQQHEMEHSDFEVSWEYHCDNPQALTHVDVQLFHHLPDMREIKVQYVTPRKQGAATLTSEHSRLKF